MPITTFQREDGRWKILYFLWASILPFCAFNLFYFSPIYYVEKKKIDTKYSCHCALSIVVIYVVQQLQQYYDNNNNIMLTCATRDVRKRPPPPPPYVLRYTRCFRNTRVGSTIIIVLRRSSKERQNKRKSTAYSVIVVKKK